ncbi:hypothetical protein DEU34_2111 [Microbacterium sp. AG1240]|uniref:hypothetical protein n=1 Tax=Microbacterium sp. AG1240 TaxID=2183992 RepID=UPI000F1B7C3D|nr:hypothetical protein [Microbacterium sp. AG1240]RKT33511.1 hypothetical protein DEU34_2111 [Microbacterium sp. AG1240]
MVHRSLNSSDREYFLPPIIWPTELRVPPRPPLLTHLDLAQWIRFGRAIKGRGETAYIDLLEALREGVRTGRIRVVLSGAQYREVIKIKDPAQRRVLASIIEELTDFTYLASHVDIQRLELQATLDHLTGTSGLGLTPIDLLGKSALNVVGRVGGLRIIKDGEDITSRLLAEDPSWVERLATANLMAERMLLHGPDDDEAAKLRADGYQPQMAEQHIVDNAIIESDWSKQIDQYRSSQRIRDLVIARHLYLELMDMLAREQVARGIQIQNIFTTPAGGTEFVMSMPSSAVVVSMKAQYHQDPNRTWTPNDLYDIDALAVALPYCDIVFADASARDAALRRGLDLHFDTFMPRRPEDLTTRLRARPTV